MARIRAFEEVVAEAHADGRLPGLLHLSIGGEAVAVGVIEQLQSADRIYTGHRGHGHFLAAGSDPVALMAELAGRDTGLCRGRGGSMHLMGPRAVMATGVVGGTLPIAVGHSLAVDPGAVVAAFFGDGSVQTGVFHESLNLAALWQTPVLFVCENNGWAEFTSREEHTSVQDVVEYARLHQLEHEIVDGGDVAAVRDAAARLLVGVRSGGGPAMLECHVTRIRPHYEGDLRRIEQDSRDPIERAQAALLANGTTEAQIAEMLLTARHAAEHALAQALESPIADPAHDEHLVFARPV